MNKTVAAKKTPLPDMGDLVFMFVVYMMLIVCPNMLLNDGSTCWHIVSGKYILKTLSIPNHDLISYTFSNAPWVAYEWLSDAIFAFCIQLGGLKALVYFVTLVLSFLYMFLYEDCRKEGANFLLSMFLVIVGAIAASLHWLARPHIFTLWGVYIFSKYLERYHRGTASGITMIIACLLTMILWVNLHPAFAFGVGLIGIYLISEILIHLFSGSAGIQKASGEPGNADPPLKRAKTYLILLVSALAATLVNPYGIKLHWYIIQYLKHTKELAATDEFQSPAFHGGPQSVCLEIIYLLVFMGLVLSKKKPSLPRLLCCLVFMHLSLSSLRNIPLFVIVAIPFIGELFASMKPAEATAASVNTVGLSKYNLWIDKAKTWWHGACKSVDDMEPLCQMHLLPIFIAVILFFFAISPDNVAASILPRVEFDSKHLPSKTIDYIRQHHLETVHGWNYDNWGGYLNYTLGMPVFIDDRVDFYPEQFFLDYGKVNFALPGWKNILTRNNIQWILCSKGSVLSNRLMEENDWQFVCGDTASQLFLHRPH